MPLCSVLRQFWNLEEWLSCLYSIISHWAAISQSDCKRPWLKQSPSIWLIPSKHETMAENKSFVCPCLLDCSQWPMMIYLNNDVISNQSQHTTTETENRTWQNENNNKTKTNMATMNSQTETGWITMLAERDVRTISLTHSCSEFHFDYDLSIL